MMYHDSHRRSISRDFRAPRITQSLCRDRARMLIAAVTDPDQQWDMHTLRAYCTPAGYYIPDDADYSGPLTIAALADFLRAELRRDAAQD